MSESTSLFRCRKCREVLFIQENVNFSNEEASYEQNLWYLKPEPCPPWIQAVVEQTGYTKGKLSCPKCYAKVGAFNFISPYNSSQSPIHIVKSKVDLKAPPLPADQAHVAGRAPVSRPHTMASSRYCDHERTNSQGESSSFDRVQAMNVPAQDEAKNPTPIPHRRSLSAGALAPLLATASNFNSSLSLSNPLAMLRSDPRRNDCGEEQEGPSLLDNLFAMGQAAVEAANLTHGSDDNSDDDHDDAGPAVMQLENGSGDQLNGHNGPDQLRQEPSNQDMVEGSEQGQCETAENLVAPEVIPDMSENYRLMCPVCLDPYYNPHKCQPCKHVFCDPCLRRMRKTDMNSATRCPLCRVPIKKCVPHTGLSASVTSMFPDQYRNRHKVEKKQKHKLPPLPGNPVSLDNKFGQNMLATWSAVCGVVLLMMFVFCVFATLVGFVLWYTMEVVLDVVGELCMEISDLFSFSWQALIIFYIDGQIPLDIREVLSGCGGRIIGTLSRLVNRTKVFFTEGEVPPPQVPLYIREPQIQFNNTTHVLTKVTQANVANYVFLAGLVTYVLYRVARYLQNINAHPPRAR